MSMGLIAQGKQSRMAVTATWTSPALELDVEDCYGWACRETEHVAWWLFLVSAVPERSQAIQL